MIVNPLTADIICQLNKKLTGNITDENRKEKVEGCFSSLHYYESVGEQVISIVRSIIKNHYFVDGNKRTAVLVLYLLSEYNHLHLIPNEKLKMEICNIASSNLSVTEIARLLF